MRDLTAIPGYPGYYITRDGDVYSRKRRGNVAAHPLEHPLRQLKATAMHDYLAVSLNSEIGGKQSPVPVHRLVAIVFHGPQQSKDQCVRHLDGNTRNNRAENIAWGTFQQNELDKKRHGTAKYPYKARLTAEQVNQVKLYHAAGLSLSKIASLYGVSKSCIAHICSGRNWRPNQSALT